jgi:transcription initiation factor TFIIE subunit alpha
VEVALAGGEAKKDEGREEEAQLKVLPPWMIRQGMQLTAAQRGENRTDLKAEDGYPVVNGNSDVKDVKPAEEDKEETQRRIQEEYYKAYYAALMARQQEAQQTTMIPEQELVLTPDEDVRDPEVREVGTKAKRDEDDEDPEWVTGGTGMTLATKLEKLSLELA